MLFPLGKQRINIYISNQLSPINWIRMTSCKLFSLILSSHRPPPSLWRIYGEIYDKFWGFGLMQSHHTSEPLLPLSSLSLPPYACYNNIIANSFPKQPCLTHPRCEHQAHKMAMIFYRGIDLSIKNLGLKKKNLCLFPILSHDFFPLSF